VDHGHQRGVPANLDTARLFSYTLLEAGKDAQLDKTDAKDAFKNVPARTDDVAKKTAQFENANIFVL
jgi:hypothetical protein